MYCCPRLQETQCLWGLLLREAKMGCPLYRILTSKYNLLVFYYIPYMDDISLLFSSKYYLLTIYVSIYPKQYFSKVTTCRGTCTSIRGLVYLICAGLQRFDNHLYPKSNRDINTAIGQHAVSGYAAAIIFSCRLWAAANSWNRSTYALNNYWDRRIIYAHNGDKFSTAVLNLVLGTAVLNFS